MAFCKYCGKELKNDKAKFCASCGKSLQSSNSSNEPVSPQMPEPHQYPQSNELISKEDNAAAPQKKKSFISVIIIALVLIAGLGAGFGYYNWQSNLAPLSQEAEDTQAAEAISVEDSAPDSIESESMSEPDSQVEEHEAIQAESQEDIKDKSPVEAEILMQNADNSSAQPEVQAEARAESSPEQRDDSQMVMDILYLYYTTYLDCLNQQTSEPLRGVTTSYDISSWINDNKAWEFEFSAVVVDLDSLTATSDTTAQIHAQFQYKYRKRGSSNAWTDTKSTQIVYLAYDSLKDSLLIDNITINDNMVLGSRQTILR